MAKLVLNRVQTPDGTILTSFHTHDYVTHIDANGLKYMVDGGNDYARRIVHDIHPYKELSVYDDDDFLKVREAFHWGTRGRQGNQPLKWVPLSQLDTDHIEAILETQTQLPSYRRVLFENELAYRVTPENYLKAAKIITLCREVLEDFDAANKWLNKKRPTFDGKSALEIIETESGARLVEETLEQIDQGYIPSERI